MSELGELLRRAREEQGYTLDDIQETTKIRKRYLEAIESGEHKVLPGAFYVRAFIKNYAEAVGLDPEEVLQQYQREVPSPSNEVTNEPLPIKAPRRIKSKSNERLGKIGFTILMWLFIIVIVVVIWIYKYNGGEILPKKVDNNTPITNASSPRPTDDAIGKPTTAPTATPTPEPTKSPTTLTVESSVRNKDVFLVTPVEGSIQVKVHVKNDLWFEIRDGEKASGARLFSDTAGTDTSQTFELDKAMYFNIGRPNNIEITVNGVAVPEAENPKAARVIVLKRALSDAVDSTVETE